MDGRLGVAAKARHRPGHFRRGDRSARDARRHSIDRRRHGVLSRKFSGGVRDRRKRRARRDARGRAPSFQRLDRNRLARWAPWRSQKYFSRSPTSPIAFTHLRLRIFPDGGVARLRAHGAPSPNWTRIGGAASAFDLSAMENGGEVLACSDMFFGPKHNLIQPGRARDMSDGWETKRRRSVTDDTHDWVLVKPLRGSRRDRSTRDRHGILPRKFPLDTIVIEGCDGDPASAELRVVLRRTKVNGAHRGISFRASNSRRSRTVHAFAHEGLPRRRREPTARRFLAKLDGCRARRRPPRDFLASASPRALRGASSTRAARRRKIRQTPSPRSVRLHPAKALARACATSSAGLRRSQSLLEAFAAHPRIGEKQRAERFTTEEQARAHKVDRKPRSRRSQKRIVRTKRSTVFVPLIFGERKNHAEEILEAATKRVQEYT